MSDNIGHVYMSTDFDLPLDVFMLDVVPAAEPEVVQDYDDKGQRKWSWELDWALKNRTEYTMKVVD